MRRRRKPLAPRNRKPEANNKKKRAPRTERKAGGKGLLIAAGVALLLVAVAIGVVVSRASKKPEPEAKNPDPPAPVDPKGKGDTNKPKGPTDPKGPTVPKGPLTPTYQNGIGMEFVKVPKGTGWLGGGGGKPGETKVVIEQDFYLGKYEVTQEEWQAVMGANPSHFSRTGPGKDAVKGIPDADLKRFPVEEVSWDDCQLFIKKLNEKEKESGWVYRLPKEAEWEYACRGGPVDKLDSAFDFYFAKPTNTLLPKQANFDRALERTCKVGSYEPNSLGLHDIHGNLWEWCEDTVTRKDWGSCRAIRGGSWTDISMHCWAAPTVPRFAFPPSYPHKNLGLRLARVPSAPAGK